LWEKGFRDEGAKICQSISISAFVQFSAINLSVKVADLFGEKNYSDEYQR
jgi:hypothetical protein